MTRLPRVIEGLPQFKTALPADRTDAREEHRLLTAEAQFVMTRYMQMLALYGTAIVLLLRELVLASKVEVVLLWAIIGTCLNVLAVYGAVWFRRIAYHVLDRLGLLADHLGLQRPYPMMWGYRAGVTAFSILEALLIGYVIRWFVV